MEVQDLRIGVRSSDAAVTDALASALRTWVVEDPAIGPNYSLHLSTARNRHHLLFRGACVEVTTPDPQRAVCALLRHLRPYKGGPAVASFAALALVRDGRATIIDDAFRPTVITRERHLGDLGYRRVDAREVEIDLRARELVVTTGMEIAGTSLGDTMAALPPARRLDEPVAPGRYPIGAWVFPTAADELTVPAATYRALTALIAREDKLTAIADATRALLSEARPTTADPERISDLVTVLR